MARYGNFKTYTVVSLDFKKHPGTKFTPHGCRKQTTFREYAESNYQVHVTNFRQPMVVAIDNVKK